MDGIDCPNDSMQVLAAMSVGLKDNEKIAYYPLAGRGKTRVRRATLHSPFTSSENWGVHNNSYQNLVRAIHERVFLVKGEGGLFSRPPEPTIDVGKKLGEFKRRVLHNLESFEPYTTEQFVESYVGRKRNMYARMAESLSVSPLCAADAYIQAFIKDEKTDFGCKPNACPRIIQPRSPRFNIAIGVYLKPMEKALYRAIAAVFRGVTVCKGLNAVQRGYELRRKWERFDDPIAVFVDASRWDQHCSRKVIDWEHSLQEAIFPEMKQLNDMRKINRVFARCDDGLVEYKVDGCRMSGDMDTAMGNCVTMCGITWTVMKDLGIKKYEYANDGDDGVLIIERSNLQLLKKGFVERFRQFGYTMKWEGETRTFEEIEFCQCKPVYDGEKWVMIRDPKTALSKDCLTLKRYATLEELADLKNSVGWCGLAIAGNMPIYWALYEHMAIREYQEIREYRSGMEYMAHGLLPRCEEPSADARFSFWLAFGVSPEDQLTIENSIRSSKFLLKDPAPTACINAGTIQFLIQDRLTD